MDRKELINKLWKFGLTPVIAIESPELALPLADALIEGGLPVAEITFRTRAGGEVIKTLKKQRPRLLVGAGTILTVENLEMAKQSGAEFGVAPGFNLEIVNRSLEMDFPFFPGVMTPSEVDRGLSMGLKVLKFFPAEASGGMKMLKAVSAPYAHTGVQFIPTGGVNMDNLGDYLASERVLAAGGSFVAKKQMISQKKWDEIKEKARAVKQLVSKIRPE
ncbi:MAG: bifunctional 4-hydroxy-2-oxoglutarate aldolase/2-dehydro-3-deoxy-phosphogluconate aldolase [Spirochaetota bacterium]